MRKILLAVSVVVFLMFGTVVFAATKHVAKSEATPAVKAEAKLETQAEAKSEVSTTAKIGVKIGVIDLSKVLLESPQLAKAKTDFKKRFEGREKEVSEAQKKFHSDIETFSKNSPTMKPDVQKTEQQKIIDQQKKLQDMQTKLQDDMSIAQNDIMKDLMKKVETIVDKIATEKGLDLILAKAGLAYNKKELEITDEVVKRLKKQ